MNRCRRCAATYQPIVKGQEYCELCAAERAALIAQDAQRRVERFPARDLTERRGVA